MPSFDTVCEANFVEVKNAVLGEGAKASHLTYLGDATIGAGANIGAGTITCNYDGYFKYKTVIGPGALIGMSAVVLNGARIGAGSLIGAASLVTEGKEIPEGSLVMGAPGKVVRSLDAAARERLLLSAASYRANALRFRAGLTPVEG